MVLFVNVDHAVVVGRPRSLAAVAQAANSEDKSILVVAQRNQEAADPEFADLYEVGTLAHIHRLERHADDLVSLVLHGAQRVRIRPVNSDNPWLEAEYEALPLPTDTSDNTEALYRDIVAKAQELEGIGAESWAKGITSRLVRALNDPLEQVYAFASLLRLEVPRQQQIHAAETRMEAMQLAHDAIVHEVKVQMLQLEIAQQAASNVSAEQRQYMLRQQMEAIQKELGEEPGTSTELADLREALDKAGLPEESAQTARKELDRLAKMPPAS